MYIYIVFCWRQTVFWNLFGLVFAGELLFCFFYSNRFILYRYYHGRSNLALLGLKNLPLRPATKRCETPLQLHVVAAFNSRGEAVAVKLPAVCEDKDERSPKGLFRFTHVVATPEMFEWSVVALPFWRSLHVVQESIRIFVVSDSTFRSEKFGYTFTCIAFQHVSCHSIACIAQKQNLSNIDIGELMKIGIFPHSKRGKLIPKNPPGRIFRIKACSSGIVASKMDMYYCISI